MTITEFETKQNRIQSLLEQRSLDAILLQRTSNFAWATCGARGYVNVASTNAAAQLLVTRTGQRWLITNDLEAPRLEQEEKLKEQGWEFAITPWYEQSHSPEQLTGGLKLGSDLPYPGAATLATDLMRLRLNLTPEEIERMRIVCHDCAAAVEDVARRIEPGQAEQDIAALLSYETEKLRLQPTTNIVASDWRISAFRHALPTDKKVERYVMLVLCGRRWGLVGSVTRFVYFGQPPVELRQTTQQVARIAAVMLHATRPGATAGEVFRTGMEAYAAAGQPEGWRGHHQGGAIGYEPREYFGNPQSDEAISAGQVFVWNPSLGPVRSVDAFLVGERENELLTATPDWPRLEVEVAGKSFTRPDLLVK